MDEHNLVMDGSETPKRMPIEAGDMRNKSDRKQAQIE